MISEKEFSEKGAASQKKKGPAFASPRPLNGSLRKGPDPDGPGGLGAEDPVPKESGHRRAILFAIQRGGCLTEIGLHYDF
jgi:hypothetical protein